MLLGLTSVYREGFETVLFLQSLQLSAGHADGARAGAGARPRADARSSARRSSRCERKLPYKKMLIVTGVFIGFVLVVMVGQTARTMQGTGWLPITPIDIEIPSWMGLWFGVFPTWETIGAQIARGGLRDRLLLPGARGTRQAAGAPGRTPTGARRAAAGQRRRSAAGVNGHARRSAAGDRRSTPRAPRPTRLAEPAGVE